MRRVFCIVFKYVKSNAHFPFSEGWLKAIVRRGCLLQRRNPVQLINCHIDMFRVAQKKIKFHNANVHRTKIW